MKLTDHQTKIVDQISKVNIFDIDKYLIEFYSDILFASSSDGGFQGTQFRFEGGQKIFYIQDQLSFLRSVSEFIGLINFLENENLIHLSDKYPNKSKVFPIFYQLSETRRKPYQDYYDLVEQYLHKTIVATPSLQSFVERGYKTLLEEQSHFERKDRIQAQKLTKLIAIMSIAISIITLIVNLLFYTKERIVTIKNPELLNDSIKVHIIKEESNFNNKFNTKSDSTNLTKE